MILFDYDWLLDEVLHKGSEASLMEGQRLPTLPRKTRLVRSKNSNEHGCDVYAVTDQVVTLGWRSAKNHKKNHLYYSQTLVPNHPRGKSG
ncbi:hypothetical protein Q1695_015356 [Nippostrongylus brasiliensis]|nr:hypothetical protein Q1695_015356 [Nippostrongylus brasiliensis]